MTESIHDLEQDRALAIALAQRAGAAILDVYRTDFSADDKADGSPITAADRAANDIILAGLRAERPNDAILSEEAPFEGGQARRTWYVDPLDGTRDFVGRTDDFSVMIGLCIDAQPVMGVVFAPALDRLFSGIVGGAQSSALEHVAGEAIALTPDPDPQPPLRVVASRKHPPPDLARVLARFDAPIRIPRGSVGIKCGLVAAGEADLYLHPSPGTSLWDCCAPQAIAMAAGLRFTTATGSAVPYDPTQVANPAGILVGAPALHARVLAMLSA